MTPKALSREIKFRAWDTKRNVMCYELGNLNLFGGTEVLSVTLRNSVLKEKVEDWHGVTLMLGGQDSFNPKEAILMQYTGLKDKNGVEIYEGDIVLNHFRNQKLTVVWDIEIIGSHGGGWNYKKLPHDTEMTWRIDDDNIEIIGNIYEHPHLLTKENK